MTSSASPAISCASSSRIITLRLALNGRQASFDITRRPSQAFTPPKHSIDSDPPVTITCAAPERTSQNAWPIAWFELAQAVATVKLGPLRFHSMLTWLAAALFISFGTTKGWTRFFPSS